MKSSPHNLTVDEELELNHLGCDSNGDPLPKPAIVSDKQWLLMLRLCSQQTSGLTQRQVETVWGQHNVTWIPNHGNKIPQRALTNLLYRFNKRLLLTSPHTTTRDDLHNSTAAWQTEVLSQRDLSAMTVWPEIRISSGHVFLPFGCRGMLESIVKLQNSEIALSIDGKVKTLRGRWEILTLGFLFRRPETHSTVLKRLQNTISHSSHSTQSQARSRKRWCVSMQRHTTCFAPVLQCLTLSENNVDVGQLLHLMLQELIRLQPDTDWRKRLAMLNKDQSSAIELARAQILPTTRPLSDYAHFSRNVYSKVKKWADLRKVFHPLYRASMHAPTVELFSAIWSVFEEWLRTHDKWKAFHAYLFKHSGYFHRYTIATLRSWTCMSLHQDTEQQSSLLWSSVHRGIFSILPGSAAGSQPIEAFHKGLINPIVSECGSGMAPDCVFPRMHQAYPKWDTRFGWSIPDTTYNLILDRPLSRIYTNNATIGRASPHEFWFHRLTPNHRIILDGDTCYVVMWCQRQSAVEQMPAKRPMDEEWNLVRATRLCYDQMQRV